MQVEDRKFEELLALAKDNNKMLHAMRRHALLAGLLKFIIYTILIIIPLWFYLQFMAPALQQMLTTAQSIQSSKNSAEQKMVEFQQALSDFTKHIPGL